MFVEEIEYLVSFDKDVETFYGTINKEGSWSFRLQQAGAGRGFLSFLVPQVPILEIGEQVQLLRGPTIVLTVCVEAMAGIHREVKSYE